MIRTFFFIIFAFFQNDYSEMDPFSLKSINNPRRNRSRAPTLRRGLPRPPRWPCPGTRGGQRHFCTALALAPPHRPPAERGCPRGSGWATGPGGKRCAPGWHQERAQPARLAGNTARSVPGRGGRHAGQQMQRQPDVPSPARWLLRAAPTCVPFLGAVTTAASPRGKAEQEGLQEVAGRRPGRPESEAGFPASLLSTPPPLFFQHRDPTRQTLRSRSWLRHPAEGGSELWRSRSRRQCAGSGSRRRPPGGTARDPARGKGSECRRHGLKKCRQS